MSTKSKLLEVFTEKKNEYISGQDLATALGLSRNAIWKAVEQLRNSGFEIESKPSLGYRLIGETDILTFDSINESLKIPCKLKVFDSVGSTNDVAKENPPTSKPTIIISNKQTKGRGRRGRNFFSPEGSGIYMSIAFEPNFDIDKSLFVTMATALAVCHAIEKLCNVNPKIKWVNDIFVNGKKVCGILTEGQTSFESGKIDSIIVGIGLNCFPSKVPDELKDIVGWLAEAPGDFTRSQLASEIINEFFSILDEMESKDFLREYRNKCFILGKQIYVYPRINGDGIRARAIDIDDTGGLIVEYLEGINSRQMLTITTGEVNIRTD